MGFCSAAARSKIPLKPITNQILRGDGPAEPWGCCFRLAESGIAFCLPSFEVNYM
jgi:hypothetical protein